MSLNKYISQYTEKTDREANDWFLIQRGSVYYKQKRSNIEAAIYENLTATYLPYFDGTTFQNSHLSRDTNGIIVDSGKKIQSSTTNQYLSFVTSGGAPTRSARLYATTGVGTGIGEVRVYELGGRVGFYTDDGTDTASYLQSVLAFTITGSNAAFQGFQGAADYSANYDSLSYVQKTYVDTIAGAYIPLTGTSAMTGNIGSTTNDLKLFSDQGAYDTYTRIGGNSVLTHAEFLDGGDIYSVELNIAQSSTITSGWASFAGLKYGADYSANYTSRSLIDKGYADATYAPISVTGNLTVGTTTIASGTNTRILYDNAGVLGEYTISGSGSVAMTGSPAFTGTPTAPTAASGTNDTTIATTAFVAASVPPTVKLFNYYNFI